MSTESKVSEGKQERTVVVEQRVRTGLAVLGDKATQAVMEAISSDTALEALLRGAKRAGSRGQYRVATVDPDVKLVMRVTPKEVRLVEVMDVEAFDSLGIKVQDESE
jgi:hypothetical protein